MDLESPWWEEEKRERGEGGKDSWGSSDARLIESRPLIPPAHTHSPGKLTARLAGCVEESSVIHVGISPSPLPLPSSCTGELCVALIFPSVLSVHILLRLPLWESHS